MGFSQSTTGKFDDHQKKLCDINTLELCEIVSYARPIGLMDLMERKMKDNDRRIR